MAGFNKIDSDDLKFGNIISYEVATELKENIDLFSLLVPVGEVIPILVDIPGVPTPDSNIFQECNGSEITNENSPLRTVGAIQKFTPDMRDRYIKVPQVFGQSGNLGGLNNSYIFRHNHGGATGSHIAPEDGDASNQQQSTKPDHAHLVSYSFDFQTNVEPPFYTLKWFMRIQ